MTKTNLNAKIGQFPKGIPTNLEILKPLLKDHPSVATA